MIFTPLGAAGEVTGSRHLLRTPSESILLDCGMFQGESDHAAQLNYHFQFDASKLTHVVLSHGHIDHCGSLPLLIRNGYKGYIYATAATRDVSELMLYDTVKIQMQNIEHHSINKAGKQAPRLMYDESDVAETISRFKIVDYNDTISLSSQCELTLYNAGHILGSAVSYLKFKNKEKILRLAYTGDLGQNDMPLIENPSSLPASDIVISESTYGNHNHPSFAESENRLAEVIMETVKTKGKIFVPAFALGRTQALIYILHKLVDAKRIPKIPIYVDSPLAIDLTRVFSSYQHSFDEEAQKLFIRRHQVPFRFDLLRYVATINESKSLNKKTGPMIIIASSGMLEGGRILYHLENGIGDPNNTILIVGYMAEHTLGRQIIEEEKIVKIFNKDYDVKAKIIKLNAFSAHADHDELVEYLDNIPEVKDIYLVHGEDVPRQTLAKDLRIKKKQVNVILSKYRQEYDLSI